MIAVEHLTKYYGARAAIDDLSFAIQAGEVVGLLGLNGSGKTTTLRILSGLLVPNSGTVHIEGTSLVDNPEGLRARIGFAPETPPLYDDMDVHEFLTFVAHMKGLTANVLAAVDEAIAALDLGSVARERLGTLSHGFRRRVGIAQAIVHRPALILLDEPTSGLDPVQVVQMRELIRGLQRRHTIMLSSHILSEIHQVCDRILVLQRGRIAAQGTESELASRFTGSTTVKLEVRGSPAALEAALAQASLGLRHQITAEANGITQATVEIHEDGREDLVRALVQGGLGVRRVEPVQMELESIFLQLTGGDTPPPASTP